MSTTTKPERPLYRVSFARITGRDEHGNDVLSYAREIGAVWPRKNGKEGAILNLDIIPVELTRREGVIFLSPVPEKSAAVANDTDGGAR